MEKLALTAIAALGIPCILARLFSLSGDDPAKMSGAFEFRDGLVTEQSKRTFDQAQSIPLVLGATAGIIIASSIAGWNGSNRTILGAWIILAGQTGTTLADKQTQKRSTLNGAASSAVLALLLAFQLVSTSDVDTTDRAALLAGLFAAISTLYGFLSIPRQPDQFFEGKLIDRQSSGSVLETATFSWSRKLFHAQIVSKLRVTDLPALHRAVRARHLTQQHVQNARSGLVGLRVTLAKTHARALICQWALTILLQSVVGLGPQFVIFRLLQQLETTPQARNGGHTQGLFLALALGLCKVGELWISLWLRWITVSQLQIPIQATLSSLVYRKALCLPNVLGTLSGVDKANQRPRGSILTHMRLDSAKACMAYTDTNKIPMLIAKLVSTTVFLVNLIGWKSLLPGLVASVLVLPLTTMLTTKYGTVQSQQRMHRDQRVTLLKDALLAIRQLKLAAAEAAWERRIFQARKQELRQLFESAIWMCSLVFAANIGPILLAGIPIYLFALQNRKLSVPVAFTCIDLFRQLQSDFAILPLTSTYFSEALAGLRRLESFFAEREVMRTQTTPSDTFSCQGATIAWPEDGKGQQEFVLADVSVEFPDGQLSVVTGETGSGKSLLLSALAGEAITLSGNIYSPPRANVQDVDSDYLAMEEMITKHDHGSSPHPVAIVSQAPWMDNTTIRDNVLFGLPLDQYRYRAALHSCALDADLEALKDGDATLVGLKGVALSGGQRWRVALARALYSGAGVILMEDVLTAVDAEVREFLVEHAICGDLAKNRTRILVTHHAAQCQARAAYMVHLHGGRIKEQRQLSSITRSSLSMRAEQDLRLPLRGNVQGIVQGHREPASSDGTSPRIQRAAEAGDGIPKPSQDGARPPQETKATQRKRSSWSRYKVYFSATGGLRSWCFVAVVITICEVLSFAKSWWLKDWTSHMQQGHGSGHEATGGGGDTQIVFYGAVFMVLSSLTCLAMAARCFVWFVLGITASASLFESMTCAILGSSLQWLEGTPHGEIVTRFMSDINTVDQRLPHDVGYMIQSLTQVVSIILTSIFVSPSGVIFTPLLLYAYCSLGIRLISTTKALKDVSVTATSLLYDQLSSLLAPDGFLTIRTYGMSGYFLDRIFRTIDDVSSADWYHALCRIMMDLQLGMLGAVFLTSVALSAVLTEADAGTTAIALSFVMQFDKAMSSFLQRIATVEAGLDSAERIFEYSKLSGEPKSGIDPPPAWPSHGSVQVCKLVAGYHSSQDSRIVLNDISLSINPGERVGIVGRTGAGKSSLTLAFARLIHQRQGQIIIDGVDISTIELRALRQRLFVIPQDPYLFSGSLRSTLDPDGTFDNETLVAALRNVCFTCCSQADAGPSADLSFMLNEGGTNISQGQRQMLFLARALLSRPRIVIMDEATSGIDVETDTTIQVALRAGLPDTTVISVVHLLTTIADFDKVFVLEDGALVEFGTPADLCGRKGRFWDLVCHSSDREQLVCRIFNTSSPPL